MRALVEFCARRSLCRTVPDKVSAYVGTGQVGDWPASESASYASTLAEAERRHHRRALTQLRAIGPPPHAAEKMEIQRKWLARFVGMFRGVSFWRFVRITLGGAESSIVDVPNIVRGLRFSRRLWAEASSLNLVEAVPALRMPVFLFLGRHDHVIAVATSAAYFDELIAPSKTPLWFEESAHEPPVEEPEKFHRAMAGSVRQGLAYC